MLRRATYAIAAVLLVVLATNVAAATAAPPTPQAPAIPAGVQLPFQPDAELLARLQSGSCWSEFRLFDPETQSLGEVIALEWYDKLDESVARVHLRQDTVQKAFKRVSMKYKPLTSKAWRETTGDDGPDTVGAQWTAVYDMGGKLRGTAVMQVIEGTPDDDEHVSTGVLTLPGVFSQPVNVAHSAGCSRS